MAKETYNILGFSYEKEEEYLAAKREAEAIDYMRAQLDMEHPTVVLHAYRQMIDQDLFHTQVGYDFLKSMQNFLYAVSDIEPEEIPLIPVSCPADTGKGQEKDAKENENVNVFQVKNARDRQKNDRKKKDGKKKTDYRKLFGIASVACGVLLLVIVSMFAITLTSNSPTILNYQEKIINKYASWEEELNERENELKTRENELDVLDENQ